MAKGMMLPINTSVGDAHNHVASTQRSTPPALKNPPMVVHL
jgi:hypothetical protein